MRCVARLIVVAGTTLLLAGAPLSAAAVPTPAPTAGAHDHGHGAVPQPTPAGHDHGVVPQSSAGGHDHGTGTTAPSGAGHDDHGTTVAGTGPAADTRLLVLSLFAGVNGLVLMVASVQRSRTAGARDRRRAARAAAPPAV